MSTGISIHSQLVADVSIPRAHLRRMLGTFELVLMVEVTPTPPRERTWWLRPQSVRVKIQGSTDGELGIARPDRIEPVYQNAGRFYRQIWMSVRLDARQLSAIEDCRNAKDVAFSLTITGDGGDGADIRDNFQAEEKLTLPRSQWIEQLKAAGAANILLVEIPIPISAPVGAQSEAAKQLVQAESHFIAGNYGDAVGACRLALDELGVIADPLNLFTGPGRNSMTKAERRQAVLASIRHYTHPPHHTGAEIYSREDAKLALQLTASAIGGGPF